MGADQVSDFKVLGLAGSLPCQDRTIGHGTEVDSGELQEEELAPPTVEPTGEGRLMRAKYHWPEEEPRHKGGSWRMEYGVHTVCREKMLIDSVMRVGLCALCWEEWREGNRAERSS